MRRPMKLFVAAVFATATVPASAAPVKQILFSITGPNTISFAANQSPTPSAVGSDYFMLSPLDVAINGQIASSNNGYFYTHYFIVPFFQFFIDGNQSYFKGSYSSPSFILGKYPLLAQNESGGFGGYYSLSISPIGSAVPGPATWAMMLAGFSAIGLALRRKRTRALGRV